MERQPDTTDDDGLISRGLAKAVERYRRLQEEREQIQRRNILADEIAAILVASEATVNNGPDCSIPE